MYLSVSTLSCGMAYEEKIIGKYFIVGVDTKHDLSLSYSLGDGSYVGKAPGNLLRFGFNDTFLVAETEEGISTHTSYYVIDMMKDSEYAHEENFRIGPLSESEFKSQWARRLNIEFKMVPSP